MAILNFSYAWVQVGSCMLLGFLEGWNILHRPFLRQYTLGTTRGNWCYLGVLALAILAACIFPRTWFQLAFTFLMLPVYWASGATLGVLHAMLSRLNNHARRTLS